MSRSSPPPFEFGGLDGSAGCSTATQPIAGHHRLSLPAPAVGFSTPLGKQYLRAALAASEAECYFRLAEAFTTQSEPAFCGLATLAMVLNALEVDPGRKWKQNWRWYDESMFACCVDLEQIKNDGIIWRRWCLLAREHGLSIKQTLAVHCSMEEFRQVVMTTTASDDKVLVLNYNRAVVGQVGDGHYSPVGAYLAEQDMLLVFDVARFKHPPHWLPLSLLWKAILQKDASTGFARGFAVLERDRAHLCDQPASCCVLLSCGHGRLLTAHAYFSSDDHRAGSGEQDASCKQTCRGEHGGGSEATITQSRPLCDLLASMFGRHPHTYPDALESNSDVSAAAKRWYPQEGVESCRGVTSPNDDQDTDSGAGGSIVSAVRGAESAEEELWLAMRSMPAAAAALAAVRDDVGAAADEETRARFDRSRQELTQTSVHRALTRARSRFRQRDGPLPVSIDSCAVLSLLLCAIVREDRLRELLPHAATLLLDEEEPLLADSVPSAIAEDILCTRAVVATEMARRGIRAASPRALRVPSERKVCDKEGARVYV